MKITLTILKEAAKALDLIFLDTSAKFGIAIELPSKEFKDFEKEISNRMKDGISYKVETNDVFKKDTMYLTISRIKFFISKAKKTEA